MELKQIKELMTAMERSGIKKLSVKETSGFELQLERQDEHAPVASSAALPHTPYAHPHFFPPREHESHHRFNPAAPAPAAEEAKEKKEEGKFIKSPMVGTFYASPSPDDPAYVKVGDRVDENTVVCIIEAMKVMNEVKAGVNGVISEIRIDNAHPVEFGTILFKVV